METQYHYISTHPKTNPTNFTNYKPNALAYTIYKLFMSKVTSFLTTSGEYDKILHQSVEKTKKNKHKKSPMKNIARQIQVIIAAK
jgi:hypothetical protein